MQLPHCQGGECLVLTVATRALHPMELQHHWMEKSLRVKSNATNEFNHEDNATEGSGR